MESLFLFLSDFLMFTPKTYARLVAIYNEKIWPVQIVTFLLGCFLLYLIFHPWRQRDRIINFILFVFWAWVGVFFHYQLFATINFAAFGFSLLFLLQASLFLVFGVVFTRIRYAHKFTITNVIGVVLFVFSLGVYPAVHKLLVNDWSQVDFFGVSSDVLCISTMGLILITNPTGRWFWLCLPLLWGVISSLMAWVMFAPMGYIIGVISLSVIFLQIFSAKIERMINLENNLENNLANNLDK